MPILQAFTLYLDLSFLQIQNRMLWLGKQFLLHSPGNLLSTLLFSCLDLNHQKLYPLGLHLELSNNSTDLFFPQSSST